MPVSSVAVTQGSGAYLHTWQRTVSSVNREEQYVQLAEPALPTFSAIAPAVSAATSASHLLQVMAGASAYVRIHRISVEQVANATSAAAVEIALYRLTAAGSGGTSITPQPFDTGDTASATAMSLPSSKGTEASVALLRSAVAFRQAVSATSAQYDDVWEWRQTPGKKPIIIPAGTSNGVALKIATGVAGATVTIQIEFSETSWL